MFRYPKHSQNFIVQPSNNTLPSKENCNGCNLCTKECAFLEQYGNPGEIAELCKTDPDKWLLVSFECSLCGLCSAVCPKGIDPSAMFLEYRRKTVEKGKMDFSEYNMLLNYEKKGTSSKYTYYHIPENCSSVFFPGCSLPGTRPETTLKTYAYLQKQDKSMGIVLDCCTKPSHDLGRQNYFDKMLSEMKSYLLENGINTIIVACPSCYKIFNTYGKEFELKTVYDIMANNGLDETFPLSGNITVHDPCPVRFEKKIHDSVRLIANIQGLEIKETSHQKSKTFCCGEGGSVGCLTPEHAKAWTKKRTDENKGQPIATYCAGCVTLLSKKANTFHILDLVFDPEKTMARKVRVSKAPFTYFNRLKLKKHIKKLPSKTKRERV